MSKEKIYIKNDNLVIEVPLTTHRSNPYDDNYHPEMPNIIGLIESTVSEEFKERFYDCGFCYRIDMSYAGKSDQLSGYFYKFYGTQEQFEQLCKKLKIDIAYTQRIRE